jgi:hypothetical protein
MSFDQNPPLVFDPALRLPAGQSFGTPTGIWTLHAELPPTLTFISRTARRTFEIPELNLGNDPKVFYIDFIDPERQIFIYATRNSTPTGFLISLEPTKPPIPRVLSFALDTIVFHQGILTCFCPIPSHICIVSKHGISLHTTRLKTAYSVISAVSFVHYYQNYVLLCCQNASRYSNWSIHRFRLESSGQVDTSVLSFDGWSQPIPRSIVVLSHSILLFAGASFYRFQVNMKRGFASFTCPYFDGDNVQISVYDDGLLVSKSETTVYLDMLENEAFVIGSAMPNRGIRAVCDSSLALSSGQYYEIMPNYQAIGPHSTRLIAALFRRKDGLFSAVTLLTKALQQVPNVGEFTKLITDIGPFAKSSVAQVRFARAIQFSGILDPHLILLGLLEYRRALSDAMIDEAKIPLLEMMVHPGCRFALKNLLMSAKLKLSKSDLEVVIDRCTDGFEIDSADVADILDYAQVCIEHGRKRQARRLLLRAALDRPEDRARIRELEERLQRE